MSKESYHGDDMIFFMHFHPNEQAILSSVATNTILGIDEAGRGPWAGPVVIAGVILTPNSPVVDGIDDSKKISEKKRKELYNQLIAQYTYEVVIIEPEEIDKIGIGKAVTKGMNTIISKLPTTITFIDGYFPPSTFPDHAKSVIDGDALLYAIASASIIAKHTRDEIMIELDKLYPAYGFAKHKGYGTKLHLEMLQKYGISPIHRKSYKPVKKLLYF